MIDYTNLTDDQKQAAEEIIRSLKNLGDEQLADQIAVRFGIVPPKIFNIEETEFIKAAKKADLYVNVQGYVIGEDGLHYCIVCINDDIRKMEKFIEIVRSLD